MYLKPQGTYDIYKDETILYIEEILQLLMEKYNYKYIRTPLFENSNLFYECVGMTTDIVNKETYEFTDRGNSKITLRPEGTTGAVRCYIENKLYKNLIKPVKVWYYGPMYRYEKPQSGRFREFYQFGVEAFGVNNPALDAEIISIPVNLYKSLGLKGIKVRINSLGNEETREKYKKVLIKYFEPYLDLLCDDCKKRFYQNPLRVLDCKVDHHKEFFKSAPKIYDYLTDESRNYFESVKKYLKILNIDYEVSPTVVRGLDYYTDTVFEVRADIKNYKGNTVLCGGGRYNDLIKKLTGFSTPAVGFAMGIERLLTALSAENIKLKIHNELDVYIYGNGYDNSVKLCNKLRKQGFTVDFNYTNCDIKEINAKYIINYLNEDTVKIIVDKNILTMNENKVVEYLTEN